MAKAFQRNAFQNNAFQVGLPVTNTSNVLNFPVNAVLAGQQPLVPGKSIIEAEPPRIRYKPIMSSVDSKAASG